MSQPDDRSAIREEILDALQMPPEGLKKWFEHVREFCHAHGGERVYGELLALVGEYEKALEKRK